MCSAHPADSLFLPDANEPNFESRHIEVQPSLRRIDQGCIAVVAHSLESSCINSASITLCRAHPAHSLFLLDANEPSV